MFFHFFMCLCWFDMWVKSKWSITWGHKVDHLSWKLSQSTISWTLHVYECGPLANILLHAIFIFYFITFCPSDRTFLHWAIATTLWDLLWDGHEYVATFLRPTLFLYTTLEFQYVLWHFFLGACAGLICVCQIQVKHYLRPQSVTTLPNST